MFSFVSLVSFVLLHASHTCLECPGVPVLPHPVPVEAAAVHRDVDARRQRLHERQRAAEVEQAVRAAERVRDHRAGQDDGLAGGRQRGRERRGGFHHRVGAVRDQDPRLGRPPALVDDARAVGGGHLEAVDHHQRGDRHVDARSPEPQHLGQMRVLEEQRAVQLVVLLVERAAGDEDPDGFWVHGSRFRVRSGFRVWGSGFSSTSSSPRLPAPRDRAR